MQTVAKAQQTDKSFAPKNVWSAKMYTQVRQAVPEFSGFNYFKTTYSPQPNFKSFSLSKTKTE
jgi:hypothetical protein